MPNGGEKLKLKFENSQKYQKIMERKHNLFRLEVDLNIKMLKSKLKNSKKSENKQSVTIIFSDEEIHRIKIHMLFKFEVDRSNSFSDIAPHRNVKVKLIERSTKKSENQQSVTIIISGEETHKIHMQS